MNSCLNFLYLNSCKVVNKMEQNIMKEVEDQIQKILAKNKDKNQQEIVCTTKNLHQCLSDLSLEFDYLDVSCMEDNIDISNSKSLLKTLVQLVNSSYSLLKLYKDTNKSQNEKFEHNSRLSSDHKSLIKSVEHLRKDLDSKERQLEISKEKLVLEKLETTELKNKMVEAKKEISLILKEISTEKNRHRHEMNKILEQNKVSQDRFMKHCGEYVSKEKRIVDVLDSYKKNEEKHLKMIEKLQENNQILLEEILTLKGELMIPGVKNEN